jgi:hypothetical protein
MAWIGTAVVGGTILGGLLQGDAAKSAANTQANAALNAQGISQSEFNTITQQEQPFLNSGYGALNQLNYLMGTGGNPSGGIQYPGLPPGTFPAVGGPGMPPPQQVPQGYDPSSGYQMQPNGSIRQLFTNAPGNTPATLPGGNPGGLPPGYTVNHGLVYNQDGLSQGSLSQFQTNQAQSQPSFGADATQTGNAINVGGYPSAVASSGGSAAGGYGSLLAPFTADTFKQYSPAYQFQRQQGEQGVLNSDAANQGALSGASLKDLMSFNQNLANTSFNTAFNQYQTQQGNVFSRLAGIAQLGQAAASNTGQQGTALAGQAAQSATNVGTAQAAGQIGAANAWSGSLNSTLPWLMAGNFGGSGASPGSSLAASNDANVTGYGTGWGG